MDPLKQCHFGVLCAWGGVVLTEAVFELLADDDTSRSFIARVHSWVDLLVEAPLLLSVLVTGTLLAARTWPPSPLLWTKLLSALAAVGANLACVAIVIARYQRRDDAAGVKLLHGRVRVAAATGTPFAAVAAYLGLTYFQ